MVMNGKQNRYPFTATQWMELENQAIIFKCMASGLPIPSDLVLHMRRSILLDSISSSVSSSIFSPHQHPNNNTIGWGYGRKVEDPEPGRCRRTDGKKWRCSKAAHPDSKYCERHMLRGKSRSRKPVETPRNNTNTNHKVSISSMENTTTNTHLPFYPYCYPRPSPGSASTSTEKSERDLRYFHGIEGEETERFSGSLSFTPLGMGSPPSSTYLHQQQQDCYTTANLTKEGYMVTGQVEEEKQHQQHCFVLGADFKLLEAASKDQHDSNEKESSFSNTQLSISTPIFN